MTNKSGLTGLYIGLLSIEQMSRLLQTSPLLELSKEKYALKQVFNMKDILKHMYTTNA